MTKLVDLTYPIQGGMFKYPTDDELKVIQEREADGVNSGYVIFQMGNHHGTHIDSPAHKIAGGNKIDQYPLNKFVNEALVLNLTREDILKNREIRPEDIKRFLGSLGFDELEQYTGRFDREISGLIIYTGFSEELKKNKGLQGKSKNELEWKFPYIAKSTAEYIVEKMPRLNMLGIDSFSIDDFRCDDSHKVLLGNETLLLETLVNVKELIVAGHYRPVTLVSMPLVYGNADAAQTRAYAICNSQ